MALNEYQQQVDTWAQQFDPSYFPPLAMMARLTEETGEVAREINHLYGPKQRKPSEEEGNLGEELSDVIFTICCIANSEGIDLDKEFRGVMEKCLRRDNDRFKRK